MSFGRRSIRCGGALEAGGACEETLAEYASIPAIASEAKYARRSDRIVGREFARIFNFGGSM
jgi:hypothetical protein